MSFIGFGALSFLWLVFSAIYIWGYYKRSAYKQRLPELSLFTAGVFISVWLLLLPVNYAAFELYGARTITSVIMALLNTLQVFINDGSTETFNSVSECAAQCPPALRTPYTLYAALLIVAAPILTLSNVLMMFKGVTEELRFAFAKNKRVCIMSQLNNCSVTLAKSIMKRNGSDRKLIVFTDVDYENAENELMIAAKEMNAVILKKAVTELDLARLKKSAELFFIGGDENENVTRALTVTQKLDQRRSGQDIKIFAFAHSRAGGCIIDSVKYDNLLNKELFSSCEINIDKVNYTPPKFRLRRVDIIRQFVWNQVAKMNFFDGDNEVVSILIIGFGTYGLEFFRTLSWFCRLNGRKLEINIVDKNSNIKSVAKRHCPGLLTIHNIIPEYSVEFFSGVNIETDGLAGLLDEDSERAERLKRTTHAVIALGSDEADTEAAIHLREVLERASLSEYNNKKKQGLISGKKQGIISKSTKIYSVLYDDCLWDENLPQDRAIENQKGNAYEINFIGGLSAKYSYDVVCNEALEMEAFKIHTNWILEKISQTDKTGEAYREDYINEIINYEKREYFRLSSISRKMYEDAMSEYLDKISSPEKLKYNEHSRWMLYMCANGYTYGYIYGDKDSDTNEFKKDPDHIAKVHQDIICFDDLSESDQNKDRYIKN